MKRLLKFLFKSEQDMIEEYLAKSGNIYELERRQRNLFYNKKFL